MDPEMSVTTRLPVRPHAYWAVLGLTLASLACYDSSGPFTDHPAVAAAVTSATADPNDLINQVKAQILRLVAAGALNPGQANSLTKKLDQVASLNAQGNDVDARTVLQNFIDQVNNLAASGRWLTPAQAAVLTDAAQTLWASLGPNITSFAMSDGSVCKVILVGNSITLVPVFSGGSGSIDQGIGPGSSGVPIAGFPPFSKGRADQPSAYTLTVASAGGSVVTATVNVFVLLQPVEVVPPQIVSFEVAPATISAGSSATLLAEFAGGVGTIDQGVGPVTSGVGVSVSPTVTTFYTLTVKAGFCSKAFAISNPIELVVN